MASNERAKIGIPRSQGNNMLNINMLCVGVL